MKRASSSDNDDTKTNDKSRSKRSREEEEQQQQIAPQYGSKEYWEARYKSHLPDVHVSRVSGKSSDDEAAICSSGSGAYMEKVDNINHEPKYVLDGIELNKDAISPGHAWYFTYEELRPLILPLILGTKEEDEGADTVDEELEDGDSLVEEEEEEEEEGDNDEEENDEDDEDGNGETAAADKDPKDADEYAEETVKLASEQIEKDSSDVERTNQQQHLEKPKKVLEVGCGDVPLGLELARDLVSMQIDAGVRAELIVDEITCIDYSDNVVKTLIDKQKKEHHNSSSATLQASFDSLDARDLPYAQNSYDIVIEKGTLDAMLSDPEEGIRNCIQTVKEMARVTNVGGSILIVSHLNANEDKGMGWLEDVVFSGLKEEFKERRQVAIKKQSQSKSDSSREKETENEEGYVWSVEVHGGEGQIVEGNEEEEEEVGEITFGPAVYIIRKKSVTAAVARELYSKKRDAEKNDIDEEDDMAMPPVKVTFLTYG